MRQVDKDLGGRTFDMDSAVLLSNLTRLPEGLLESVKIYGGQLSGWLKAIISGIRQTPAIVLNNKKYLGLKAAKDALDNLTKDLKRRPATILATES